MPMPYSSRLALAACLAAFATTAQAEVTVLGWPGGPEETALRAAAEAYNAKDDVAEADKVELLFFNRDGFWDKLQADLAAGSTAFDANLIATYSIGRYAPFMEPMTLSDEAVSVYGDAVLSTMQFDGQQYGVPTDLSLHFLYYRTDLIEEMLADEAARADLRRDQRAVPGQGALAEAAGRTGPGRIMRRPRSTSPSR